MTQSERKFLKHLGFKLRVLEDLPKEKRPTREVGFAAAKALAEYIPGAIKDIEDRTKEGQVLLLRDGHGDLQDLEYATGWSQAMNEEACKQKDNAACALAPKYIPWIKRLEEVRPKQEKLFHEEDSRIAFHEACEVKHDMAFHERVLNEQKDVARVAGVADAHLLYESGRVVAAGLRKIASLEKRVKEGTGKPIDFSRCPIGQ